MAVLVAQWSMRKGCICTKVVIIYIANIAFTADKLCLLFLPSSLWQRDEINDIWSDITVSWHSFCLSFKYLAIVNIFGLKEEGTCIVMQTPICTVMSYQMKVLGKGITQIKVCNFPSCPPWFDSVNLVLKAYPSGISQGSGVKRQIFQWMSILHF